MFACKMAWVVNVQIFQEIQVRRRQIGGLLILKRANVAFWWHVSLNFGACHVFHEPRNLDLH